MHGSEIQFDCHCFLLNITCMVCDMTVRLCQYWLWKYSFQSTLSSLGMKYEGTFYSFIWGSVNLPFLNFYNYFHKYHEKWSYITVYLATWLLV
jgi:hypothetical protein